MPREKSWQQKQDEFIESSTRLLAGQSWRDRRQTLETVIQGVQRDTGSFSTGILVARILERLDDLTVVDNDQALIFAMSARAEHQAAACDWFIGQSLNVAGDPFLAPPSDTVLDATIH